MEKENLEEYMELFYTLDKSGEKIRTKKIAEKLKTTKGNVSQALAKLKQKKLIKYEPYHDIELTNKGKEIGKDILRKHEITENFLTRILGINPEQAHEEACRIEHAVSKKTIEKLSNFVKKNEK